MNRASTLIGILMIISLGAYSQNISSVQDGLWSDTNTWSGGVIPNAGNSDVITIDNNVTITSVSGVLTIDGTTVNSGATLTISGGATLDIASGVPNALVVQGDIYAQAGSLFTNTDGTNVFFDAGSVYHHQFTNLQGVIPLATWDANSITSIEGYTSFSSATAVGNWSQDFGNFIWNCTGQTTSTVNLNGLLTSVQQDLTISSTNGGTKILQFSQAEAPHIVVGGNFSVLGTSRFSLSTTGLGTILDIGGDFIFSSTNTTVPSSILVTTGNCTINLAGNFTMNASGSTFRFVGGSLGVSRLNLTGDFEIDAGTIILSGTTPSSTIDFVGNGTQQFLVNSGSIGSSAFNFIIESTSTLDIIGESALRASSSGSLTVNGTIRCGSLNSTGAILSGTATLGNIRVNSRTFASGSTIVYSGVAAQVVGNGHPSTAGVNMEIDNPSGVTLNNTATTGSTLSNLSIGGDLILTSGDLNIDTSPNTTTRTLTINGNIISNGNNITVAGTRSDIVINGTGALGTFPFPSGAQSFRNLTVNRTSSGSVDFGNDLTITGTITGNNGDIRFNGSTTSITAAVTLSAGTLDFNGTGSIGNTLTLATGTTLFFEGQTLTVSAGFSGGGLFSSNNSSTLILNGGVQFGTLAFSPTGNTIGTLTLTRASGTQPRFSLNSALTVATALNLTNGTLDNVSGLAMTSGATITRTNTSTLTSTAPTGGPYNLVYTGSSLTTGLEAQGSINDLTVNSSNTVTGGTALVAAGQFHILAGIFTATTSPTINAATFVNDATYRGQSTNFSITGDFTNNGTFNGNTSTFTFAGTSNILGTTPVTFNNVVISGTLNGTSSFGLLGNFTNNGTFNAGTSTVTFSGTTAQSIQGSAITTFNNITDTNTGATVRVESSQNLAGVLTLTGNPTIFDADGSANTSIFTMLSTGDSPTADASIATLGTGASVIGSVTVQRYMSIEGANSGRIYRYISSPVQNAPVSDIQNEIPVTGAFTGNNNSSCTGCNGSSTQSMFSYNEAAAGTQDVGYVNFPSATNTEIFQKGVGYTIYVRGNILSSALWDLRGVVNQGSATIPVSFTSSGSLADDGWNMVGNPYPSTIDWNASSGWTKAGLDGSIYIRDNGQTVPVYATWNGTTGTNGGSRYISTGQGFWVKAVSAPSLIATESVKVAGTQTTFIRQASLQNILRITMRNSVNRDETVVHLRSDATEAFDSRVDTWKLTNATFNLSSVLSDGTKLAINSLPLVSCPKGIRLDVTSSAGSYKLDFSQFDSFASDVTLTLVDNFTGKSINIRTTSSYDFQVTSDSKSYGSDRFVISIGCIANIPSVVTGVDNEPSILSVYPNPSNGQLHVEFPSSYDVRSVKMFSNFGVELGEISLTEDNGTKKGTFDMSSLSSGLYFVRAYHAGKLLNIKVSKE